MLKKSIGLKTINYFYKIQEGEFMFGSVSSPRSRHSVRADQEQGSIATGERSAPSYLRPSDVSIVVADNSHGYAYVRDEFRAIRTIRDARKGLRHILVDEEMPVVPQRNSPLIEDGNYYRIHLAHVLRLRGYMVFEAPDGLEQALLQIETYPPNLVILGSELKTKARQEPSQEATDQLIKYILQNCYDTRIILTRMPQGILPPGVSYENVDAITIVQKPYPIPSVREDGSNPILSAVRQALNLNR